LSPMTRSPVAGSMATEVSLLAWERPVRSASARLRQLRLALTLLPRRSGQPRLSAGR